MQFDSGAASPVNGYPMGEFDRMKMKAAAMRRAAEEVKDRQNLNCDEVCADWPEAKDDCVEACNFNNYCAAKCGEDMDCWFNC